MDQAGPLIHLVNPFVSRIGGAEQHTLELARLLAPRARVTVWCTSPAAPGFDPSRMTAIQPYRGAFPVGGTLVIAGTYFELGDWIRHTHPERVVVLCVLANPDLLFARLRSLREAGLPAAEIAYVSDRLRRTIGLPGHVVAEPMDTDAFAPVTRRTRERFTVGRLSRDDPGKHHPDDVSLYKMLAGAGCRIRIMGGTPLASACARDGEEIELLPAGHEPADAFLGTLDCFIYRTGPSLHEASGRVVLEAMACGLPVVAHLSGGYTDWIRDGDSGLLFSTQEEAYEVVMGLRRDPHLCKRIGAAARAAAIAACGKQAQQETIAWYLGDSRVSRA